jgi:hypothetical protein
MVETFTFEANGNLSSANEAKYYLARFLLRYIVFAQYLSFKIFEGRWNRHYLLFSQPFFVVCINW